MYGATSRKIEYNCQAYFLRDGEGAQAYFLRKGGQAYFLREGEGDRLNYKFQYFATHLHSVSCSSETKGGGGCIHFLKALFKNNSELNISRP